MKLASKAASLFASLGVVAALSGCSAAADDNVGQSTAGGLTANIYGQLVNGYWERSVECGGAHFDRFRVSDMSGPHAYADKTFWQLVVSDRNAVTYLNGKIDEQKRGPLGLNMIDASNVPHGPNEIIVNLGQITGAGWQEGARAEEFGTWTGLGSNEGNITVNRFSWFSDQGGGNYKKANDMKLTYKHNGWSDPCTNYEEATGICRSYASGGSDPRPGWGEFEISNWTFRGCRNL